MTGRNRDSSKAKHPQDTQITRLEALVKELLRDSPQEAKIKSCMETAGLSYSSDPIDRMNRTLAALDSLRMPKRPEGERRRDRGQDRGL